MLNSVIVRTWLHIIVLDSNINLRKVYSILLLYSIHQIVISIGCMYILKYSLLQLHDDTRQDNFSDRGIYCSDQASDHRARPYGIGRYSLVDE